MNLNQEVRKRTRVISKKVKERTLIRKQRFPRRKKQSKSWFFEKTSNIDKSLARERSR